MMRYGLRVKLNHQYPERRTQFLLPRLNQIWDLLCMSIRYLFYWIWLRIHHRIPLMDYFNIQIGQQIYGVPIGGIGSGTIGRGFKGEFCRYALRPGMYQYKTIDANQFILTVKNSSGETVYQKVLSGCSMPKKYLSSWDWTYDGSHAEYVGLYPRSWTTYNIPEQNIVLRMRQISPVLPNDYTDSCLPCAVFIWSIENNSNEEKNVSIAFTFSNGIGEKKDKNGGCWSEKFRKLSTDALSAFGVMIHHLIDDMPYTYTVAIANKPGIEVSSLQSWNPRGSGSEVWNALKENGNFLNEQTEFEKTKDGEMLACAVCGQSKVSAGSSSQLEFSLAWDMPCINFGGNKRKYFKYYTRFFGRDNLAGAKIVQHAFDRYSDWEALIDEWQRPVLDDPELPDWYKGALFNETYFVSDGGSVWLDLDDDDDKKLTPDDPRRTYGRFAYLEGHEYRMYNTYDVHFYASFALAINWPKLQCILQRDMNDCISREDPTIRWHLFDGEITERKKKNSVPHDVGDPGEEPFVKINSYPIHDVSEWRDLNLKFVLQCYRDFALTSDLEELKTFWPNIKILMRGALRWDADNDGLIENHGCPDQTYDTWIMKGPSAYCGSLWLAALQVTKEIASILEPDIQNEFENLLNRGKAAFQNKLWNGKYYNFDCSGTSHANCIMSDQLCGLWYLLSSNLPNEIVPKANALSALDTIYNFNVMNFKKGSSGAVNGMLPNGKIDYFTVQSEEVWTGVVYAYAALLLHFDKTDEAFKTAQGLYETVYEQIGMGFETPEAIYEKDRYRAIGYMRPLSIWAMQLAWNKRKARTILN